MIQLLWRLLMIKRWIKTLSLGCALAFASGASAFGDALPLDVLDTADVNYTPYGLIGSMTGIADAASLGTGGGGDHFDSAFGISVDGAGYAPTEGFVVGGGLDLESQSFGQFDVSVNMMSSGPIMRQIVTVTNNGSAGSTNIQWHNNTGNDSLQQNIASSSGDLLFGTDDRWLVTADNTVGDDNEVNAWMLYGAGGLAPSFVDVVDGSATFGGAGEQGVTAIYNLNLAAGETASLMFFVGIEGINMDGIDLASGFNFAGFDIRIDFGQFFPISGVTRIPVCYNFEGFP